MPQRISERKFDAFMYWLSEYEYTCEKGDR